MLKTSHSLGLQQKLSPQLIQAQLLLAVPTLALEQEIKKQLEENPVLEDSTIEEQQESTDAEKLPEKKIETEETGKEQDLETYNIDEWYNYSGQDEEYSSNRYEGSQDDFQARSEYLVNKNNRLKESPIEQLYRAGFDEMDTIIGEEIIGSLDSDGYLRDSVDDIIYDLKQKHSLEITHEDFERVLKIIQKFDPIGIASRNFKECLSVQIEELELDEETKSLCLRLINDLFDDFKSKHFEKIAKLLNISLEKVNELFEIIHKLNPIPGNMESAIERDYIYPDFIVSKDGNELLIELTSGSMPVVRISRKYIEMFKAKNTTRQTKEFLKKRFDSAKWFIDAIQSRRETMMNVMKAIIARQKEFFLSGGENIKPMYEKDIAEDISMDISTISRTVRNKYVQTDFGTYELKYFFSNPITTDSGEDVSSKLVKEKIREYIEKENKSKPLSDDSLTKLMNQFGFPIARRTVAKYRESMKIPKATLRRKILL